MPNRNYDSDNYMLKNSKKSWFRICPNCHSKGLIKDLYEKIELLNKSIRFVYRHKIFECPDCGSQFEL